MNLASLATNTDRFGIAVGVHDLVARAAKRAAGARVLQLMEVVPERARASAPRIEGATTISWLPLSMERLGRHVGGEMDLDEDFLRQAHERGDECLGFLVDDRLAHYEFFSHRPTSIDEGLWLECPSGATYGYKAFTHPDFRGNALHRASIANAVVRYAEMGSPSIISYVVSNNFPSIRSHERAGFAHFGSVALLGMGDRARVYVSRGARARGISVHAERPAQPADDS